MSRTICSYFALKPIQLFSNTLFKVDSSMSVKFNNFKAQQQVPPQQRQPLLHQQVLLLLQQQQQQQQHHHYQVNRL